MSKDLMELLKSDGRDLNKFELFIQTSIVFLMQNFIFLFISLIISSKDNFWIVFSSFEIYVFFYCIVVLLRGFLEDHFNMYDANDSRSLSYEGLIVNFCILNIGIFLCCFGIGYAFGVLLTGFALGLIFIFPPYFMFFRRDVYTGPNVAKDFGFDPRIFWFLGIFSGFGTVLPSFKFLEAYFLWNSPSLVVCLSLISISLLWICLVLSPDIWNKYLPFIIKSNNGISKYIVLVLVISVMLSYLFGGII